jgi:hypothetical protein
LEQTRELIQNLNRSYELQLTEQLSAAELEDLLAEKVNRLIREDFGALVQLLYRVDVSEGKLRAMLDAGGGARAGADAEAGVDGMGSRDADGNEAIGGEDAGRIIARLIMERQWQKIETRKRYSAPPPKAGPDEKAGNGEERW